MPTDYDKQVDRLKVGATMPEEVVTALLKRVHTASIVLANARVIQMSRGQARMPALAALATANFVNGDTGLKKGTDFSFKNKELFVEEIAAWLVIPDAVADDSAFDLWSWAEDQLVGAVSRKVDQAVLFQHDRTTWPAALAQLATAAGKVVHLGDHTPTEGGVAGDIGAAFALVEDAAGDVTTVAAARTLRGKIRQARNSLGIQFPEISATEAYGVPITYGAQGVFGSSGGDVAALVGDFSRVLIGLRQDITVKIFDQGVITDETAAIVVNLMEQDAKAMRVTFRMAYQVDDSLTDQNYDVTEASRVPFSVIRNAAPVAP